MRTFASAVSDRGLKREGNEDHYLVDESLGLYVVCDGMGGHAAGEVAAEKSIEFASEYLATHREVLETATETPTGFSQVLDKVNEAFQTATSKLHRMASSSHEYAGMGTTMTMVVIVDNKAVMSHVGDSRLYLLRCGEVHQLSVDHTLANELLLAGSLTKEEAETSRFKHVLTRTIGSHEYVDADTLLFDLLPGDRLLICSDGLSNYFKDAESIAGFIGDPDIFDHPDRLIDYAKSCGGDDNITAVLVKIIAETDRDTESDTQVRLHCLKHSFLGTKLSVSRLMQLLEIATLIQCNSGMELVSMGKKVKGLYVVMDGSFRVVDDDIIESQLTTGDCFGESSLMVAQTSPATLIATEPSRVLLIERKAFDRLARRRPRLGNALLRNLTRYLSQIVGAATTPKPLDPDDTGPLL